MLIFILTTINYPIILEIIQFFFTNALAYNSEIHTENCDHSLFLQN